MKTALITGGAGFFGHILKRRLMGEAFARGPFDAVFHCAALLAHAGVKMKLLS